MPEMIKNIGENTLENFLHQNIDKNSNIAVTAAAASVYAFYALRDDIKKSKEFRLLLTNAKMPKPDQSYSRRYELAQEEDTVYGNKYEISLLNQLNSAYIARQVLTKIGKKMQVRQVNSSINEPPQIMIQNDDPDLDIDVPNISGFDAQAMGSLQSDRISSVIALTGIEANALVAQSLQNFNGIWNDENSSQDVTQNVIDQIKRIYQENTPEWIYYVSLYHIFHEQLGELDEKNVIREGTGFKDTTIWNRLYKFQKDGVIGLIEKLEKYNGAILADSVGLGKTYSALAVIKYYELRNDRVLVLTPKRLRNNWSIYTMNDKRNDLIDDHFNYDVLNHTDLSRYKGKSGDIDLKNLNWGNYDLVVIDESHNFRNNVANKNHVTRYQRFMQDVIKAGVKTKVLMLSATPVNNRMTDLKNQIAFITQDNNHALAKYGIEDLDLELKQAQTIFNQWSKLDDEERTTKNFLDMVNPGYFKILDLLTIARSRKHIEKYYGNKDIGKFPDRLVPINEKPNIDTENRFIDLKEVNERITQLHMALYTPMFYILPNKRQKYADLYDTDVEGGRKLTQADRESALTELIRVNLLQRMESSINSFTITLKKIIGALKDNIQKIDDHAESTVPLQSISDWKDDEDFEEFVDDNQLIGNKVRVLLGDMDLLKWRDDLQDDLNSLNEIYQSAKRIDATRDAKLATLVNLIDGKVCHPINDDNKKIIIFTKFADTANYLYEHLSSYMLKNHRIYTALVTGANGQKTNMPGVKVSEMDDVLVNFSPISKHRERISPEITEQIDLLIATDAISEGQNLQDCDYLINYDIHWNPVRVIQRFGRIDRIGSRNTKIQLVNFWPNMDLDEYMNLEKRVRNRMVLMNTSATGEDDILNVNQKTVHEMNDMKYRSQQLKQLQSEVLDLEDMRGAVSITDITFADFKTDLSNALKKYANKLETAPKGMFAIADANQAEGAEPGVIFVLKSKHAATKKERNSLAPYLVTYIKDDDEIKIDHLHAKQVMDMFKKLCDGQNKVFPELVDEFNSETSNGRYMDKYTDLLQITVDRISGKEVETGIQSLFGLGGTHLNNTGKDVSDYQLVSFLVIKEGGEDEN